jgi:hypothetical protein
LRSKDSLGLLIEECFLQDATDKEISEKPFFDCSLLNSLSSLSMGDPEKQNRAETELYEFCNSADREDRHPTASTRGNYHLPVLQGEDLPVRSMLGSS